MNVNIVVRVNGTQYTKASVVMATVNIEQTLDALMIAVNIGRMLKNDRTRSKENARRFI